MSLPDLIRLLVQYAMPVATLCIITLGWALSRARKLHYPPGPPETGIISGNLSILPAQFAWDTYIDWGAKYGAYRCQGVEEVHQLRLICR